MATSKKISFTLETSPNKNFRVGWSLRFIWADLYLALDTIKPLVSSKVLHSIITSFLSSGKDITHKYLWKAFELLEKEKLLKTNDTMKVCAWIIAAYGYMHGCPLDEDSSRTFPHPRGPRRMKKVKFIDWRDSLVCPVCGRIYRPIKGRINKEVILREFGKWLDNHFTRERH
jgi:hypothetical protein